MNEKRKILEKLFAKQRFGIKPGLERTLKLANYFSNPHDKYITIHIAGTNGKGSVASYLASLFTEAGYKTGLYTSPHLVNFNERIRINGKMISDEEMVEIANDVMPVADDTGSTFFEITTVMAFEYFARKNIDIAIIEAGMGGRYDSTNIIKPALSVITSVDLDHQVYLGNSIEEIAYEKAGIIKKSIPVVINEKREELKNIFIEVALENNSDLVFTDDKGLDNPTLNASAGRGGLKINPPRQPFADIPPGRKIFIDYLIRKNLSILKNQSIRSDSNIEGIPFINDNLQMELNIISGVDNYEILSPLPGLHQVENLKTAVKAYELLKHKFSLSKENLISGIKNVKLNTGIKYRTEIAQESPLLIADAAHNPAAISKLAETLHLWKPEQKYRIIFGAMKDKDLQAMLKELLPITEELILTQAQIERTATTDELYKLAKALDFKKISKFYSVEDALEYFFKQANPGIITGSFYITGEALEILNRK